MGKRQTRIFRKDIPRYAAQLLLQPEVQVVLRSRVVLHGVLQRLDQELLELQDPRFHTHVVPLEQVEEIIYDLEAPY